MLLLSGRTRSRVAAGRIAGGVDVTDPFIAGKRLEHHAMRNREWGTVPRQAG